MEQSMNQLTSITNFAFLGLFMTSFLLLMAVLLSKTKGLFLARSLKELNNDQRKANTEKERQIGQQISAWIFKYIPPFFAAFLLLFLFLMMF